MSTRVLFNETKSNGEIVQHDWACFGPMYGRGKYIPLQIEYFCEVDESLNKEEIDFYVNFIEIFLDTTKYSYKFIDEKHVFTLHTKELSKSMALLYLTAFRYLDEFAAIIKDLFQYKNLPAPQLFEYFVKTHYEITRGIKKIEAYNLGGHGLATFYGGYQNVSLEQIRDRIKNKSKDSCFSVSGIFERLS